MDDFVQQAFAHLNVHDRLLKLAYAEGFAKMPHEEAAAICKREVKAARSAAIPADSDTAFLQDHGLGVLADAANLLERFLIDAQRLADRMREAAPKE